MKTFRCVVFASIAFNIYLQINDVIKAGTQYPVFKKGADLIKNIFCLNNDWNVIISEAEKDQDLWKTLYSTSFIYGQKCIWRDVKCCVTTQKITGMPFVDQKNWFSLLQTLTYYTLFY